MHEGGNRSKGEIWIVSSTGLHYAIGHYFSHPCFLISYKVKDADINVMKEICSDRGYVELMRLKGVKEKEIENSENNNEENRRDIGRSGLIYHKFSREKCYLWDSSDNLDIAGELRGKGFTVVNGGEISYLEHDRASFLDICREVGVRVGAFEVVETFEELERAVERFRSEKVVIKGEFSTILADKDEALFLLRENEEEIRKGLESEYAIVQEFIEGYEISCEVWVRNGVPVFPLTNFTIETKRFLAGDLGKMTGGETNLVFFIPDGRFYKELEEETLKFLSHRAFSGYTGEYDINYIIDENGRSCALEITPRIGYPGTITLGHILYSNGVYFDEMLQELVRGGDCEYGREGFGFGVKVSIPPYPFVEENREKEDKNNNRRNLGYFRLELGDEVKIGEAFIKFAWDGCIRMSDEGGVKGGRWRILSHNLGVVNSWAFTPELAIESCYRFLEDIQLKHKQYRIFDEHMRDRIRFFLEKFVD